MNQKLKALIRQNQAEAAILRPKRRRSFMSNRFGPLVFLLIFTAAGGAFVYQSGASPLDSETGTAGAAKMYITPTQHQLAAGSQLVATIWADSYAQPVNTVQAVVTYPADKLRYVESDASSSQFTVQAALDAAPGKLVITRSSTQPLTGNQLVAGVVFEPLVPSDGAATADIKVESTSQLLASDGNRNILGTMAGGSYTLSR